VLRVAASYGLLACQVDTTHTSLAISHDPDDAPPMTLMWIVHPRGLDHTCLQGITDLARAVVAERLDVEVSHRRLDRILSAPHPYRRRVHALGWAGVAGAVAFQLGGSLLVALWRR
jgi:uncharacterized membrane protein YjjP (DUF1212 family)